MKTTRTARAKKASDSLWRDSRWYIPAIFEILWGFSRRREGCFIAATSGVVKGDSGESMMEHGGGLRVLGVEVEGMVQIRNKTRKMTITQTGIPTSTSISRHGASTTSHSTLRRPYPPIDSRTKLRNNMKTECPTSYFYYFERASSSLGELEEASNVPVLFNPLSETRSTLLFPNSRKSR